MTGTTRKAVSSWVCWASGLVVMAIVAAVLILGDRPFPSTQPETIEVPTGSQPDLSREFFVKHAPKNVRPYLRPYRHTKGPALFAKFHEGGELIAIGPDDRTVDWVLVSWREPVEQPWHAMACRDLSWFFLGGKDVGCLEELIERARADRGKNHFVSSGSAAARCYVSPGEECHRVYLDLKHAYPDRKDHTLWD